MDAPNKRGRKSRKEFDGVWPLEAYKMARLFPTAGRESRIPELTQRLMIG